MMFKFEIDQKVWYISKGKIQSGIVKSRKIVDAPYTDAEAFQLMKHATPGYLAFRNEGYQFGLPVERYEVTLTNPEGEWKTFVAQHDFFHRSRIELVHNIMQESFFDDPEV